MLLWVVLFLGLVGSAWGQVGPDLGGTAQDYERRSLVKMKGMVSTGELTDLQSTQIAYLLREQHSMVELFTRHGLLGAAELEAKVGTIREVTRFTINDLFTPEQLARWWTWDLRLDEAELAKPVRRERVRPGE